MAVKTVYMTSSGESFNNKEEAEHHERLWYSWEREGVTYAVGPDETRNDLVFRENGQTVYLRTQNDYRLAYLLDELYKIGTGLKPGGDSK